jgi:hypothetical protein
MIRITYYSTRGVADYLSVVPVDFADDNDAQQVLDVAREAVEPIKGVEVDAEYGPSMNAETHIRLKLLAQWINKRLRARTVKAIRIALEGAGYRDIEMDEKPLTRTP